MYRMMRLCGLDKFMKSSFFSANMMILPVKACDKGFVSQSCSMPPGSYQIVFRKSLSLNTGGDMLFRACGRTELFELHEQDLWMALDMFPGLYKELHRVAEMRYGSTARIFVS
jgi:hypothetical protein